jgi:hypothetical protein
MSGRGGASTLCFTVCVREADLIKTAWVESVVWILPAAKKADMIPKKNNNAKRKYNAG